MKWDMKQVSLNGNDGNNIAKEPIKSLCAVMLTSNGGSSDVSTETQQQ